MKFLRPDTHMIVGYRPTDRNDHENERSAVELALPDSFSEKAKACWEYFEDAAFIFEYKNRLVVTDESRLLSEIETPAADPDGFMTPGKNWKASLKRSTMNLPRTAKSTDSTTKSDSPPGLFARCKNRPKGRSE